ncbi:hypothetical protein P12x_000064 [Tundrisphaera lichenicola]|uniref:hypothetical protein n=1 Tax=Tundrisphaera lichenicola TaxID=2029860 RepID=UPI003EBB0B3F
MRKWSSRIVRPAMVAFSIALSPSMSFGQTAPTPPIGSRPVAPKPPATPAPVAPKPSATPAPADEVLNDPWEERKERAREDVEFLESRRTAKLAEIHEAEVRVAINEAWKVDHERQKKKGILSPFQIRQATLILAEGESQLAMKRVDLKDVEIRLARARRKVKAIEQSPGYEAVDDQAEDRFRDLEIKYDRLRSEFDRIKRYVDNSRDGQDQWPPPPNPLPHR